MTQAIECHYCNKFIDTILSDKPLISFHEACFEILMEEVKAGCIRIGMRIHESKDLNNEEGKYNNYD